jgi:uncharacterized sulfatase
MPNRQPSVVVVFMDDMGYGDMGCFGSTSIRTPNMDRIGETGVRFTQMYASASICTPSRCGLLTGRYAQRAGIGRVLFPRDTEGLGRQDTTIAEYLKSAGYATCMAGKWHLGCCEEHNPVRHGFDEYFGLLYSNDMSPLHLYNGENVVEEEVDQATLTRRYTDRAIEFVQAHRDEPFFVYLAHTMPHIPLHVEPEFRGTSDGGTYGDTIECIDFHLGRLMDKLDEFGLAEDTLLIVTSDNGPWFEGSTGGFRGRKFDVYEGGVRMPFVARRPGTIPAGTVCEQVASQLDLLPTIANLAGVDLPEGRTLDGIDITPSLIGGDMPPREQLCYYFHDTLQAIRVGKWKLHVAFGFDDKTKEMPQLFDMDRDPGESYNLAEKFPDVVADLKERIDACAAEVRADRESRT